MVCVVSQLIELIIFDAILIDLVKIIFDKFNSVYVVRNKILLSLFELDNTQLVIVKKYFYFFTFLVY